MDFILNDHSPSNLEATFNALFLYDHPLFSLMAEQTELTWLLVIPKQPLDGKVNKNYTEKLFGAIYELIDFMQEHEIGQHFNLAKIGNKNPNQHIHLIFRKETDEVWPDAVWCHEPLTPSTQRPQELKAALAPFFKQS